MDFKKKVAIEFSMPELIAMDLRMNKKSNADIAEAIGRSENVARMTIGKAILKVKKAIEENQE